MMHVITASNGTTLYRANSVHVSRVVLDLGQVREHAGEQVVVFCSSPACSGAMSGRGYVLVVVDGECVFEGEGEWEYVCNGAGFDLVVRSTSREGE